MDPISGAALFYGVTATVKSFINQVSEWKKLDERVSLLAKAKELGVLKPDVDSLNDAKFKIQYGLKKLFDGLSNHVSAKSTFALMYCSVSRLMNHVAGLFFGKK